MPSPTASMKTLSILAKKSRKIAIKLFPQCIIQHELELVSNILWLIVDFHGRWDTFSCNQQKCTKSNSKIVKGFGRKSTSSITLEVSVKMILAYNKLHRRQNPFQLKVQVCGKVRLTQLKLHGGRHKLSLKLYHYAKISLRYTEWQPTHNKSILSLARSLNWV